MSQYKQYPSFKVFSWNIQELNGLSYRSLQQEAKIHGIRAKQNDSYNLKMVECESCGSRAL